MVERKLVTIKDIAIKTSCSVATVSRVLSDSQYPVSKERKKLIQETAKEMGYIPNLYGRMLKTNQNRSIGIIIPSFQNPFYMQIVMGIEKIAKQEGYQTIVISSQRNPKCEREGIEYLISHKIECLMLTSIDENNSTLKKYIQLGGIACVFEASFEKLKDVINARIDMIEAGTIAMDYLISNGHRNISFLTSPINKQSRKLTLDGCRLSASQKNIDFSDIDIIEGDYESELDNGLYEFEMGKMLAGLLLKKKKRYTAIIAINDLVACGVINELKNNGIKVPQQMSVISFDDIPTSVMVSPALTTIHWSARRLGQLGCQLIINNYEKKGKIDNLTISINPKLVIRDSVENIVTT